jgi:hypothetical protein
MYYKIEGISVICQIPHSNSKRVNPKGVRNTEGISRLTNDYITGIIMIEME